MALSACSPMVHRPPPSASFSAWLDRDPAIKKICVLPFTNQTDKPGVGKGVRRSVYSHLSVRSFHDVELAEIDATLRTLAEEWRTLSPQALGQHLGCDGLVYGKVIETTRLYLAVYSNFTLGGAIRLVDVGSGCSLVEASHTTKLRAGGVPLSPFGVIPASVLALHNILNGQMERAIDDLGRHLVEFIPNLAVTVASARPISDLPAQAEPANRPKIAMPDVATATPPAASAAMEKSHYRLQVASFLNSGEAERAVRRLQWKGYHPSVVEVKSSEQSWHRVLLGPFSSVKEAQETRTRIQETLGFTPLITWVNNN